MRTGFVTETHMLAFCAVCGKGWRCDDELCPREACCLGNGHDGTNIADRLTSTGWHSDGTQVLCRGCAAGAGGHRPKIRAGGA